MFFYFTKLSTCTYSTHATTLVHTEFIALRAWCRGKCNAGLHLTLFVSQPAPYMVNSVMHSLLVVHQLMYVATAGAGLVKLDWARSKQEGLPKGTATIGLRNLYVSSLT